MSLRLPSPSPADAPPRTPAGRPANVSAYPAHAILKPAPWTWMIPAYFFLGGAAGAAATIGGVAELAGRRRLAARARMVALAALLPCPPLLILDLGRPARFLNMLRIFRPTSPMNLGTWLLSAFGGALSASLFSRPAGLIAAALGPALATYTSVLLANTSTPAWHGARRHLPFLFATGAASSGGAAVCLVTRPQEAGPARRLAIAAALAEVGVAAAMERGLGEVGAVYSEGRAAAYARASRALSLGGAATLAVLGRRRPGTLAGSLLVMGGACLQRFAVWEAGSRSAELT